MIILLMAKKLNSGMSSWLNALKEWNKKKGGKYVIPKKGSSDYNEVKKLMK